MVLVSFVDPSVNWQNLRSMHSFTGPGVTDNIFLKVKI